MRTSVTPQQQSDHGWGLETKIDAAGEKTKSGLTKAVDATVNAAKKTKGAVQKAIGKSEEAVAKAADKGSDAAGTVGDKMSDTSISTRVKAELLRREAVKGYFG